MVEINSNILVITGNVNIHGMEKHIGSQNKLTRSACESTAASETLSLMHYVLGYSLGPLCKIQNDNKQCYLLFIDTHT